MASSSMHVFVGGVRTGVWTLQRAWRQPASAALSCLQVKVVAAVKLGSYPDCPDAVIDMDDLDTAPALVSSAGTYNVVGETQLPLCG
jgi:hypothetical protein